METDNQELTVKAAKAIGTTAGYLQTHDVLQIISDAEDVARRNPVQSLVGAAALGLIFGAILRRD